MEKKYLIATFFFLLICSFIIMNISKDWEWYQNLIALGIIISLSFIIIFAGLKETKEVQER